MAPNVKLEPTTLRLKVSCSTDRASQTKKHSRYRSLWVRGQGGLHRDTLAQKKNIFIFPFVILRLSHVEIFSFSPLKRKISSGFRANFTHRDTAFFLSFILGVWVFYDMSVCALRMCSSRRGQKRASEPGSRVTDRCLWAAMWVLRHEPEFKSNERS